MNKSIPAVRFRNLDEAKEALREAFGSDLARIFDDGGEEPQGLLTVVPEDRVDESLFYKLYEHKKGTAVRVEKIKYSGYGPPAEETDYMGFVTEGVAYVLEGSHLPIEISSCPNGARDIHHLEAMVLDQEHPIDREALARKLHLPDDWDFENLFDMISDRSLTADEIDKLIHQCIH